RRIHASRVGAHGVFAPQRPLPRSPRRGAPGVGATPGHPEDGTDLRDERLVPRFRGPDTPRSGRSSRSRDQLRIAGVGDGRRGRNPSGRGAGPLRRGISRGGRRTHDPILLAGSARSCGRTTLGPSEGSGLARVAHGRARELGNVRKLTPGAQSAGQGSAWFTIRLPHRPARISGHALELGHREGTVGSRPEGDNPQADSPAVTRRIGYSYAVDGLGARSVAWDFRGSREQPLLLLGP